MFRTSNIWFRCPACDKRLVVDRAAGGCRADCPECGRTIPIPERSTILPSWARTFALAAMQGALLVLCGAGGWVIASSLRPAETAGAGHAERPSGSGPMASDQPADNATVRDSLATETNPAVLEREHAALQGRYDQLLQWMMDNYRGKYPLPESLVSRLRIPVLAEGDTLNPELAELLRMTDEERGLVQDIFDYVRRSLNEAEMDRAMITEVNNDSITITVPTFPDIGSALREDLYLTLESTLGGPRFDRMVDVSGEAMREQFGYFGEASRSLTFQVIYPQRPGEHPPYVLIRDGWVIPEGDSSRVTRITETAINELPDTYRTYAPLLPEGVSRYATP